jgi:hypothetical protein
VRRPGFTISKLLVTIAIIAVLIALLLPSAARPDGVGVRSQPAARTATQASGRANGREWFWGAVSGALAIGLIWAVRSRSRAPAPALPDLPLSALKALAAEPQLTGPQAALIISHLQSLRPADLERIQRSSLLPLDDVESNENFTNWDRFAEERLGESLLVECPSCEAVLGGIWLRPTIGCPSCHHRFLIEESPFVTIQDRLTKWPALLA